MFAVTVRIVTSDQASDEPNLVGNRQFKRFSSGFIHRPSVVFADKVPIE